MNQVSVQDNLRALLWGRRGAVDRAAVEQLAAAETTVAESPATLQQMIEYRSRHLTEYRNPAYAERYRKRVEQVRNCEQALQLDGLTFTVAKNCARLLAYQAPIRGGRLYSDPWFRQQIADQVADNYHLEFHFDPPFMSGSKGKRGHKRCFGPWMLQLPGLLSRFKGVRGSWIDPFRNSRDRKLIADYDTILERLLQGLNKENLQAAICPATGAIRYVRCQIEQGGMNQSIEYRTGKMKLFTHHEFDNHEQVVFCHDATSGLKAIIAIHNTNRGPALGGCRMYPYASEEEALNDVLRLSRGMTYKSALAGLPLGGGKSVIIGDPGGQKTPALMRAMGVAVERLAGRYIVAEDSGTGVSDMQLIGQMTRHVSGIIDKCDQEGNCRSGDPSPVTAHGIFAGIQSAVRHQLGKTSLQGIRVAIQGVGNVGHHLARELHQAGAKLWVSDINSDSVRRMVDELGAIPVSNQEVFDLDVDVFAPCALGAILNDETIPRLQARIVAGSANNQLAEQRHGIMLAERGILYAPDYVINAGGVIDVYYEGSDIGQAEVLQKVDAIGDTLSEIFQRAQQLHRPTHELADQLAEERFTEKQFAA